ncbi:uncharacterized protein [Elaeis guineensis]|uniref:Uncharacterized protein LOC105051474 isoform X1 n=2 Tax=Elaeis guineensis var. tenera TaxID=51953 RepID=A0A6I9RQA7_ELAGV|nr:uncharacterized protein LOC105051474 isoform X1 [Elaeis guineensis]XP_010930245.1 uncharacterized protein LOC105051474 isoform X1 [Elaeis guineensis]XP_029122412.1 uncharacterized protein LOC105051474 isoform X1 [Elaeis guineensis]
MDVSFQEAKRLWSLLWHKDDLLDKKRRWLLGPVIMSTSESSQKKSKRPKHLTDVYLLESDIRSDEVSSEIVRANVERCFGSYHNGQGTHHVVQDYLQHFGMHNMESNSVNPPSLKTFSVMIDNLNNDALCAVANIVSNNNVSFKKTHPRMRKVIKNYLRRYFTESNFKHNPTVLKKLSDIFRNPCNFQEKHLTLTTPISPPLLSAIYKVLERLGEMPIQDLIAMNRRLKGLAIVPQFPPVLYGSKKDMLLKRVRKRCEDSLSKVKEGDDLPERLAKALSVMLLSLKLKSGSIEMLTSTFYPFPPDIVGLQHGFLNAIWSFPKFRYADLKALKPLVDPEARVPTRRFRISLKNYLKEYLFACDEINIPKEVQSALSFINGTSKRRPCMFSKETREEEVEAVLSVSSQFKQIILDLIPDHSIDDECGVACAGGLGTDESSESDDFELSASDYFSGSDDCEHKQTYDSCSSDEAETFGDSRPNSTPITASGTDSSQLAAAARNTTCSILKDPKLEHNKMAALYPDPEKFLRPNIKNCFHRTASTGDIAVQDICDRTAVFAHGLIGCMLDKFLQFEGRDVDVMTRSYLRGGLSPIDSQGAEVLLNTPKVDLKAQVLIQAVEELLPSFPKSCIERVKKLMEQH